jgi:hypothetical protein
VVARFGWKPGPLVLYNRINNTPPKLVQS